MSKKNISGTSNTLFNYFSRSPSTNNGSPLNSKNTNSRTKEKSADEPAKKIFKEEKSPIPNIELKKAVKRELENSNEKNKSLIGSEDEDEIKLTGRKKRRRIIIEDDQVSDDNDENYVPKGKESDTESEGCNETSPVKKKQKKSGGKSFKEKLNAIKQSSQDEKKLESFAEISERAKGLGEPVMWPHNSLEFLKPEKIRDKKGRRPDHPDYDPTTLYVPEKYLNGLTPGLRRWWELKSEHFDCVLFYKVGKFYEFYHMDADVGVRELNFTYMKGEFAHSGFPEVSYDKMSTNLIGRGYKVARVEQTETPDMMAERCKTQKNTTKFDKVVKREICQITTKGTQVFGSQSQVTKNYQPNYMLVLIEKDEGLLSKYGICFVDTSIGDIHLGEFSDDKNCSRLLTLVSHYPPVLIIHENHGISQRTQQILKTILGAIMKETLTQSEFSSYGGALKYLAEKYYSKSNGCEWPETLKLMQAEDDPLGLTPKDDFKYALKALNGCICYLQKCLLDQLVLAMARFHVYVPPDVLNDSEALYELAKKTHIKIEKLQNRRSMVLDSITLRNLRITGEEYSLQTTLDHCCTKFGKRLLQQWVCSPSCDIEIIRQRQNAISELISKSNVLQEFRSLINPLPDFERHLAQIHGFGNGVRLKDHPDGKAILFEEKIYNKKKIQNFISILRGFKSLLVIPKMFSDFESELIRNLTQLGPEGNYPELNELLEFFQNAFDHEEALKEGTVAPEKGVDKEFDAVEEKIEDINKELKKYLAEQEKYFGCKLTYFGNDKKRFQLEVPESKAIKAGSEYVLESQRRSSKPVRRFYTAETKALLKQMMQAEEQRNSVLKDLARRIFEKFSNHYGMWKKCVDSIANLDVLASLAEYVRNQNQTFCIPEIVEDAKQPFIDIEDGYHPCINSSNYIQNGVKLGGPDNAPLTILTGPNMGGKSTLMRQVGLLAVMAQMGCHIPAESCRMSIIDRIFTRLGAQDDILAGYSTFLVELSETSAILKHATENSLVLLDELGRGTATYDGTAIAASVVHFLAGLKCRTLFSTHYHNLVDYFQNNPGISLGHMACMVENEDADDPTQETVTFLYKFTSGACPKSYGFNAAKLAGLPFPIIRRAFELSKKVEADALKRKILSKIIKNENVPEVKTLIDKMISCKVK